MPKRFTLAFLVAMAAAAQEAPPQPTFRAGTDLVQVSVVARDKDGKAVADLRREDFQIFDNGSQQQIRLFIAEKPDSAPPRAAVPGAFTNQIATEGRAGYSLLLFDNLNIDPKNNAFANTARARIKALKAFREIPPGDKIAIYALGCKFQVVREFTSDRDSLLQRLNAFAPAPGACMDPPDPPEHSAFEALRNPDYARMRASIWNSGPTRAENREPQPPAEPTLGSVNTAAEFAAVAGKMQEGMGDQQIGALADHLAGIPGRKNLIWLTSGFHLSPSNLTQLVNAGVAVYPVDTVGSTIALDADKKAHAAFLRAIAAMTGGVAYVDRDDLDVAIREALTDGRISYTLGFYRPDQDIRKSVHQIGVRVSRPGVTLRYRTSYTVEPPPPKSANPVHDLVEAMNRPINATAIGMTVSAVRRQNQLDISGTLDVAALDLELIDGRWKGKAELVARFMTADGILAGKVVALTITFNLRPATYTSALQQGLRFHREITIPSKSLDLNLVVGNLASGKIGTLTIPLSEVAAPPPGK
jgi:VWFA-related protein